MFENMRGFYPQDIENEWSKNTKYDEIKGTPEKQRKIVVLDVTNIKEIRHEETTEHGKKCHVYLNEGTVKRERYFSNKKKSKGR